jgi:hypothetical protein
MLTRLRDHRRQIPRRGREFFMDTHDFVSYRAQVLTSRAEAVMRKKKPHFHELGYWVTVMTGMMLAYVLLRQNWF